MYVFIHLYSLVIEIIIPNKNKDFWIKDNFYSRFLMKTSLFFSFYIIKIHE